MAVAGGGGMTPSQLVQISNGKLEQVGLTHNVPREYVISDMELAARLLCQSLPLTIFRIDVRGDNFARLAAMVEGRNGR